MKDVLKGARYFFQGFSFLKRSEIRILLLSILLIYFIVFSGMVYLTWYFLSLWIHKIIFWLPDWLKFLEFLIWPLILFSLSGVFYFIFMLIGNIVTSPFSGLLAEKIQYLNSSTYNSTDIRWKDVMQVAFKSFMRELQKIKYHFPKFIGLLLFSLIPFVNLISLFLWLNYNSWMSSIQYCDFASDNRSLPFSDTVKALKQKRLMAMGFGFMVYFFSFIPIVNLLVIPVSVIGGTLLWEEQNTFLENEKTVI